MTVINYAFIIIPKSLKGNIGVEKGRFPLP